MAESATRDKPLSCQFCNKSFGRSEHLKRHILTHTRSREYQCRVCRKAFFRKDALSRHEHTHQTSGPTLLQRGGRACIACASSKTRCSGQAPCARCQQRSLQCTYPEISSNEDSAIQGRRISAHIIQEGVNPENGSEAFLQHTSDQVTYTAQQAPQEISSYEMIPVLHADNTLSQTGLSTSQFEGSAHIMNGTDQYQETHSATGLYPSLPVDYTAINWLGFEDGAGMTGTLDHEWQYPDHMFNFYMPASDTHSISQVSPAASRDLETANGGSSTRLENSATSPQDAATTSTLGTDEIPTTPGQFYADGGTARLPRMKKRRALSSYAVHEHPRKKFSMLLPSSLTFSPPDDHCLDDQGYTDLQLHYSNFCTSAVTPFAPFENIEFPHKALFDYLCGLYVENCSSVLPFLHVPTLRLGRRHPFIVLAMAAIGSHYLKDQNVNRFVLSMHEFMRRVLFFASESADGFQLDLATQYQITLLHAVGATYCGDETLRNHAFALRLRLASFFFSESGSQAMTAGPQDDWHHWVERESSVRLRYCTWLMDCIWSFQFQTQTMLSLSDARLALPADEKLWNATTAPQWTLLIRNREDPLDLAASVDDLYISKRVKADAGEFARILLIYGLHRRLSEVAVYHSQRLSHWASKEQNLAQSVIIPDLPIWLPSLPVFRQWQNLTCDSLDVLHWTANATIGEASGFEHPTVLHLHLARVVLLTPIREIENLARYLAGEKGAKSETGIMVDRQAVHRWAIQHQYKARLAAIHAGVVFWHVRRFSANAFYEPTAVAHAALVLWAFSAFSSKTAPPPDLGHDGPPQVAPADTTEADCNTSDSESSSDTIILLDRPADDEIVQEFVLNGPRMRANMTGVGDLYGEKGPERVVKEGSKILKSLGCWRVWESWAKVLDRLVVVCKRERKRAKEVTASNGQAMSVSSARDTGD
ncbi:hypothetical protein E4T48_01756 [Aureobasidium sp. EXF-10727]|nr:hypothetical protein E4T48_01756 [Aureobasidium sp. EXF-10727]